MPDVVKFVFLGPLVGAAARIAFSPLTDKMGGAIWTLISGIGLLASIVFTIPSLTPDTTSAETLSSGFAWFLGGMIAIFFFTGIGNASTFKQMPMIFERRQAGGVIGWTAAIAAFGPFVFGLMFATGETHLLYMLGVVVSLIGAVLTWHFYAKPGAEMPS